MVSGPEYFCILTINNPNGEEIQAIGGPHVEGRTNADVTYVYRTSGVSTIIPSVICSQFPNTRNLDLTSKIFKFAMCVLDIWLPDNNLVRYLVHLALLVIALSIFNKTFSIRHEPSNRWRKFYFRMHTIAIL